MKPLANRDALLLQNVGDQLVVYDQTRRRLHVLSRSAALVWQHCDGHRDVAQLAGIIGRELGSAVDNEVILLALQQLNDADLLQAPPRSTPQVDSVTRREMMSRALGGLAAGVLMPVVTSCGSIAESVAGIPASNNVTALDVNTTTMTTPFSTTTSSPTSTPPVNTTTTSTTPPVNTTTTSTTPPNTTTTTTPRSTTTTSTTPPLTTTTTTTVATTTTSPPRNRKVRMCHNGKTIMVDERAVAVHLARGDTLGACPK